LWTTWISGDYLKVVGERFREGRRIVSQVLEHELRTAQVLASAADPSIATW